MGASYSSGVAYGYAIQEADTEVLELLEPLAEDENPTRYGLDYRAFKKEFPDLNFHLAGDDGDNAALVVYAEISRSDLSRDSGASGAWALPAIGGDGDTDAQLEKFSETYGIFAEPSWVAYSWIC